ncbi:MAG: 2-hydroxyacid dehydrogenase [Deltaproteobacteria bacterium]|nr:2-hydroxyacid dehydrogenase [Deltaproteobacteria bacterium]
MRLRVSTGDARPTQKTEPPGPADVREAARARPISEGGTRGAYGGPPSPIALGVRSESAGAVGLRTKPETTAPLVVHFSVSPEDRKVMERSKLAGFRNVFVEEALSPRTAHLAEEADVVTTFVHDKVTRETLSRLPNLRVIAQRATGYDNIDLASASARNVKVFNIPEYGTHTVAEFAFALLLAVTRHLEHAYERTEEGDFRINGLMGSDLHGKRMVIVGGGSIGLAAAQIAKGFGMDVVVVDPKQDPEAALSIGFRYDHLEHALGEADVISLHVPLNEHTEHLIDAEALAHVKEGAILINTARGPVVDTEALVDALDSGRIAAAGLDCFEGEKSLIGTVGQLGGAPLIDKLRGRDDVILTPHVAFDSVEAVGRIMDITAANILGARWGSAQNRVGPIAPGERGLADALRQVSARIEGWLSDHELGLEARRPIGAEISAAWTALEKPDRKEFAESVGRLADRARALGADATSLLAIKKLSEAA